MAQKMTSRERVNAALNHTEPDRIPFDLGATACSGIHAVEQYAVREKLGLKRIIPKVTDPMMFNSGWSPAMCMSLRIVPLWS